MAIIKTFRSHGLDYFELWDDILRDAETNLAVYGPGINDVYPYSIVGQICEPEVFVRDGMSDVDILIEKQRPKPAIVQMTLYIFDTVESKEAFDKCREDADKKRQERN